MEEDLRLRMESNKIVVMVLNGQVALGVAGPSDFVVRMTGFALRMTRLWVDWAGGGGAAGPSDFVVRMTRLRVDWAGGVWWSIVPITNSEGVAILWIIV